MKVVKKGFTLVELLAVIIILAAIMLIIIPLITNNVQKGTDVTNAQTKENIILSSRNWGADNKNLLPEVDKKICVSVKALMDGGYLNYSEGKYLDGSVIITNEHGNYYYSLKEGACGEDGVDGEEIYKTVTFDYKTNGGTTANVTLEAIPGSKINLNKTGNKTGYQFVGWNTNKNAHNGFESYTMPSEDVTLYAIYKKEVTATFVLQKLKGAENLETSKATSTKETCKLYNKDANCQVTAPILTSVPGSKVIGWNSKKDATTAEIASGASFNLSSNKTYYSIIEKTDTLAPECTLSINGKLGNNNWYIGDVSIHMETKDNGEAGVKQYGLVNSANATYNNSTDRTHKTDGKNITYYGYVRDGVGNTNKCSISFKRDTVKPVITSVTNSSNSKWTNKDITINAKASDATSEVKQIYYYYGNDATRRSNWKTDTKTAVSGIFSAEQNKTIYVVAEDNAGHVSEVKSAGTLMIDKTVPTCKITVTSGTIGDNSWYTSNVVMGMTTNDTGGSGLTGYGLDALAQATYNSKTTLTHAADTTGKTYYGYVKDAAGNTNKCSIKVKKDATAPTCSISLSGEKGENDWYTSDVGVTLSRSDATSKVAKYGLRTSSSTTDSGKYNSTASGTRKTDTSGVTYYGYVKDNAGNTNNCTKWFKRDATPPSISYTLTKVSGNNNEIENGPAYSGGDEWITSRVKRKINVSDNTSNISKVEYSYDKQSWNLETYYNNNTYIYDNVNENAYFRAIDKAGNISKVINIAIKIDTSSPTTWCGFNNKVGSCNASDSLSGIENYSTAGTTYYYAGIGAGCSYPGPHQTQINSEWNDGYNAGFDFVFHCGRGSIVNFECSDVCDKAGNCSGWYHCGNYSW